MRTSHWLAILIAGLGLTAPAAAQQRSAFAGVDPSRLIFQQVDTSQTAAPIARPMVLPNAGFSLANILPRVSLPGARPVMGRSIFPTPDGMPGRGYLNAFNFQVPKPLK